MSRGVAAPRGTRGGDTVISAKPSSCPGECCKTATDASPARRNGSRTVTSRALPRT
jgi:hypothetical protein